MLHILQVIFKHIVLISGLSFLFLTSCVQPRNEVHLKEVEVLVNHGEFLKAKQMIDSLKQFTHINTVESRKMDSILDVMHRIRLDFSLDETQVKKQLSRYFAQPDDSLISQWENSGKLEMRRIDGKKRYFNNAVPNLFRLDSLAAVQKVRVDGKQVNLLKLFRLKHIAEVIRESKGSSNPVLPVNMILTYTIKVKPNAVPAGAIIRCWMPFPRAGDPRQHDIKLLSSDPDSAIIAPKNYLQRTVYLEKRARKDQPTVFRIKFSMESSAQYFNLKPKDIKPYDKNSELYRKYTAQRPPQLVFNKEIRKLGARLVGNTTNPLLKVEKIYTWISDSITWASSLEYSIMPNIPEYVLAHRHGDCGMQTLLFMSLARSQGIPVRWQSGWMLFPVHVDLHDWSEVYYQGVGWVPLDQSFGLQNSPNKQIRDFYMHGIDSYRLIVNDGYAQKLFPPKKYPRSAPYDFQRGELEWKGGNLYFNKWTWHMDVEYIMKNGKIRHEGSGKF